jgi:plasmid stability protein
MFCTCKYHFHMSKMIQLRNVPDELHRTLKARAAQSGMSLSEYLLREMRYVAERPTREDILRRLEELTPVITRISNAQAVREEREKRGNR